MKFRPLHDRVVVERLEAEEKTASGIIIPDSAQEKPMQGKIIAAGSGARDETGKIQPLDVKEGDVVLIFTHNCKNHAIFGGLIAKYLLLYKLASAIVVEGKVRDAAYLKRENFSIWCEGVTPLGCYNKKTRAYPLAKKKKLINQFEGSIAICDECGVTIIPKKRINKEMFDKLQQIEIQEDLWFFCLDTLKWDTKKIVCDKAYLKDTELLSKNHIRNLSKLKISLDKKK